MARSTKRQKKNDNSKQGNGFPESSRSTELHHKYLYMEIEKKVEELMLHKLKLQKELYITQGKVQAYERMIADMGTTISLSPQAPIIPPTDHAAAPAAATNAQKGSSAKMKKVTKKKNQVANGEDKASPRKKKKKNKA